MLNGVDISNWQAGLYVPNLTDTDFVICKATQGSWFVDAYCDAWIQQCISSNKLWGFYHFAEAGTDPIDEADFFISNCRNYFGHGVPILDFEMDALNNGVEWAKTWLDYVYNVTGVRPMIYMSASAINESYASIAREYGLWVAAYPNVFQPTYDYDGEIGWPVWPWDFAAMWQYASDGRVTGYDGDIDVNHFYGDAEAWKRYAGVDVSPGDHRNGIESVTVRFNDGTEQTTRG